MFFQCFVLVSLLIMAPFTAFCYDLSGSLDVNENADTAVLAKEKAISVARKNIMYNVVSKYTNTNQLYELLQNIPSSDLMDLVKSSSITNERFSTTDYTATITMNFDTDMLKNWLSNNGIQNWIPSNETTDVFTTVVNIENKLYDWAELKEICRSANIDIDVKNIKGTTLLLNLPYSSRTRFTVNTSNAGWHYKDKNGTLYIWK